MSHNVIMPFVLWEVGLRPLPFAFPSRVTTPHVSRCAVSAVDCFPCHAPKKEGAHYFGTAVKNLSNIRTQTNKEILE